jgi:hypothetical protein
VILMNTMPLGGPKRKIFAFEMSPARVKSGVWGQRKPDYKSEKTGRRHGCLARSRKTSELRGIVWVDSRLIDGIIWTFGALMKWVCSPISPDTECDLICVLSNLDEGQSIRLWVGPHQNTM